MDYLYTLAFIKRNNQLLMVNRVKQPWMGMWNGVGGKRQNHETPLECIIREIYEETQITIDFNHVIDKGVVTWNDQFKAFSSGLHLFFVELPNDYLYKTPKMTPEGILDWKDISWVNNKENLGVSYNIPYFIYNVINNKNRFLYECHFEGNNLTDVKEFLL